VISNFTQEFTIYTDKDLFTFILRNLVQNAIKFSFDDSQIQINAKEVGEKVQVEVRDFGKGMSPEQLQNLNQTISKAGTDTRGIKSTGIGLIIAKDFAKKLKIEYEVQSKVGEGTTFSLMLNKA
jgi:signal transduction histidine kinase